MELDAPIQRKPQTRRVMREKVMSRGAGQEWPDDEPEKQGNSDHPTGPASGDGAFVLATGCFPYS
jgi:hypothetical protein